MNETHAAAEWLREHVDGDHVLVMEGESLEKVALTADDEFGPRSLELFVAQAVCAGMVYEPPSWFDHHADLQEARLRLHQGDAALLDMLRQKNAEREIMAAASMNPPCSPQVSICLALGCNLACMSA